MEEADIGIVSEESLNIGGFEAVQRQNCTGLELY